MDTSAGTERDPLTRHRIARAALAFVDEHGLPALSMRKLAAALGFEAMSLYNHVANKDDLLDEIAELLYQEVLDRYDERPPGAGWQSDAFAVAHAFRTVVLTHPEALTLVTHRPIRGAAGLRFLGEIQAIFGVAGLDGTQSHLAFTAASAYVVGSLTLELGLVRVVRDGGPDPTLPDHLRHPVARDGAAGVPDAGRFEWGLQVVLDGILGQTGHR